MGANELQAQLRKLESLVDRQRELSDVQHLDIIELRDEIHRLEGDKRTLEAERKRLSHQLSHLRKTLGSK